MENKDIDILNSLDYNNINKNIIKKGKENIIDFKGITLYDSLEIKLAKIFSDQSRNIDINDLNDLKKFVHLY